MRSTTRALGRNPAAWLLPLGLASGAGASRGPGAALGAGLLAALSAALAVVLTEEGRRPPPAPRDEGGDR